ncbi:MAG: TetR/AcrR family transcriptional regulator [Myxococcota bacterium]
MTGSKKGHAVEAARRLFDANGFHNTGIDAVVTGAEVARMTLYKHFRSKDGLVQATVRHHTERFAGYLEATVAESPDPIEGLANGFGQWWRGESPFGAYRGSYLHKALAEFSGISETIEAAALEGVTRLRELCTKAATDAGLSEPAAFGDQLWLLVSGASEAALSSDATQVEVTFRRALGSLRRAHAN